MLKWFNKNKEKKNKGFTLVELIVVIAILAILVGLLAPQYTKYVEKSRKSADASNLENLVTAFKVAASDQEYDLGNPNSTTTATTTYTIIIDTAGTTINAVGNVQGNSAETTNGYIKAIEEYAGLKFTTGTLNQNLKLKSQKWDKAKIGEAYVQTSEGAKASSIAARVTINNTTDAVTVEYSTNVDTYSKTGKKS